MLQALKHRGPDSTGFALYGKPRRTNLHVMRFKVAEQEDVSIPASTFTSQMARSASADGRRAPQAEVGVQDGRSEEQATEYASPLLQFSYDGDMKRLADYASKTSTAWRSSPSAMAWS